MKKLLRIRDKRIQRLEQRLEPMREIIFIVKDSDEGGYPVKALDYSIFTEGETLVELKENVKDAVKCHFDPKESK